MTAGFRNSDFSSDHDLSCRQFAAVDVLGSIVVGSKRRTLAENRIRASLVHYEQHQIRSLAADLESNTAAFERIHCGRTPPSSETLAGAANHCAAAITCAEYLRNLFEGAFKTRR